MSAPSWILPLDAIDADNAALVGPKIARLAQLQRRGFRVPHGFGITTGAYLHHVRASGLDALIERALGTFAAPDDVPALRDAAGLIRKGFEQTAVIPELEAQIAAAYEALCLTRRRPYLPTAVRSSASGEDAKDASFAGQYESYLGIAGIDNVLAALRRTWASLYSERAVGYRVRQQISHRDTPIGVGVLELLDARAAGVAFSIHPVSGNAGRIVIEAAWGWGEAVVQGAVTPDHVEIDKQELRILEQRIAEKKVMSIFDAACGAIVERAAPPAFATAPALDEEEILAIARTVRELEQIHGYPVDVEWVIEHGRAAHGPVALVQLRPITTVKAAPRVTWNPAAAATKYLRRPQP